MVHKNSKKYFFNGSEKEFYTLRNHDLSNCKDYSDENLMNLIHSLDSLESQVFMNNEFKESFFFFTMHNNSGLKYSIVEYKKKSEGLKNFDSLGVIINMKEMPDGKILSEKIKMIQKLLPENLYSWL